MPRPKIDAIEAVGQDSFLDVVTNIVGILIILVMVVGVRAKNSGPAESIEQVAADPPELVALAAKSADLERDVLELDQQAAVVAREFQFRSLERDRLGVALAAAEHEIAARRSKLAASEQERVDRLTRLSLAKDELARLEQETAAALQRRPAPREVKTYFTPISKTVHGKELHFQLSGGRVAFIPIEDLFDLAKDETRSRMSDINEISDRVMTVGPTRGFEMRYTVDMIADRQRGQLSIRSKEWQVVPVLRNLGEPTGQALSENSEFRRLLSRYRPEEVTVTLWTYPDSFADFRTLHDELHRLGYPTAGRPLPEGFPIGGSPHGSKSAAQ